MFLKQSGERQHAEGCLPPTIDAFATEGNSPLGLLDYLSDCVCNHSRAVPLEAY